MPESKLVDALRSGSEIEILSELYRAADEITADGLICLSEIKSHEVNALIRKQKIAAGLALSFHPIAYIREHGNHAIRQKDRPRLTQLISEAATPLTSSGSFVERLRLTQHRNGFVREAALCAIYPGDGTPLETFLRLSADWVPAIADIAQFRLTAAFPAASDQELAQALPQIYGLTRRERVSLGWVVNDYAAEVRRRPGLERRVRRAHRWGKIGLWAYLLFGGRLEAPEDLVDGLNDANALVQLEAARRLAVDPTQWPKLIDSRLPAIRRIALDLAPNEIRETALLDLHAGVRNDARFLLGKRDYAEYYRSHLPSLGAISGLGETGSKADGVRLTPFLIDERSEIRRRALESYARLLGEDARTELLVALQDPSRKVQRTAVLSLAGLVIALEPQQIIEMNLSVGETWRLMEKCARWPALLAVLESRERFPGLDNWLLLWASTLRSRPLPPAPEQAEKALSLLREVEGELNHRTLLELKSAIELWVPK